MKIYPYLKRWSISGAVAVPLLVNSIASIATASFLPGGPDLSGITDDISLPNPFDPGGDQPWSEQFPGGFDFPNPFETLGQEWSERFPLLEDILESVMGGTLGDLMGGIGLPPVDEDTPPGGPPGSGSPPPSGGTPGGLPNPYEVRAANPTRESSAPTGDLLNPNPIVRAREIANLYDQELTRASAAPVLGSTGQQWLGQKLQQSATLVGQNMQAAQQIQQLAGQAGQMEVTQDVMKQNVAMQSTLGIMVANQSQLDGLIQSSLVALQQQQGSLMQLNANISEGIDEENRRDRVNSDLLSMEASRTDLYIPGLE